MAKVLLFSLLAVTILAAVSAQRGSYEEKCETAKASDGREVDTCDSTKFLSCKDTRCACKDPGNQIWTYKNVLANSRNKRSPKKGGGKSRGGGGIGKSVLAGAAGGLAGGYIGSKLANSGSSGSSYSGNRGDTGSSDSSSSSRYNSNYKREYQCYTREGGTCLLDKYRHTGSYLVSINSPSQVPTPSTTAAPASVPAVNETETTINANTTISTTTEAPTQPPGPVAAAQVSFDVLMYPDCVPNAVCSAPEVKIVNGTLVNDVPKDPRLGVCSCQSGYIKDNRGLCVRVTRSGSSALSFVPFTISCLVLSALGLNSIYA